MQLTNYLGIFLLLALTIHTTWSWRSYKFIITSITTEMDKNLVNIKVDFDNSTNGDQQINMRVNTTAELREIYLYCNVSVGYDKKTYPINMIENSFNMCKYIKQKATASKDIVRALFDNMKKQLIFLQNGCPVKPGVYDIKNFRFDEDTLPEFLPDAQFRFYFRLSTEKEGRPFLSGNVFGEIDSSKGKNGLRLFSRGS